MAVKSNGKKTGAKKSTTKKAAPKKKSTVAKPAATAAPKRKRKPPPKRSGIKGKKRKAPSKVSLIILACVAAFIIGVVVYNQIGSKAVKTVPVLPSALPQTGSHAQPSTLPTPTGEIRQVTLYLGHADGRSLLPKSANIKKGSTEEEIAALVAALTKDSAGSAGVLPEGTSVISTTVKNSVATIDFSREFKEKHEGGSSAEIQAVYGVVNSVVKNFSAVERVAFLVEGNAIETLSGHLYLGAPLGAEADFIIGDDGKAKK